MNVKKLSDIKASPVLRNKVFFDDLDELYGRSDLPEHNIGMPKGKISLWAGESGVGKSRLCIEVAKKFSVGYSNGVVLYIQTEAPLEDFASWAKDTTKYDKIFCSGAETQKDIIDTIYLVKPKLIFIDSVNEIVDFIGNAKSSSRLIKGDETVKGLKQATHDVGAHLILLGQLNQDGKSIKGGTSLPHLVDIALSVTWKDKVNGIFKIEVGAKHRYGSRDKIAEFRHTNDGVEALVPVDPRNGPSRFHMGRPLDSPYYSNGKLWTIYAEDRFYKIKQQMVADGRIKVDEQGNVLQKDKRSLLEKLNQSIGEMFGLE